MLGPVSEALEIPSKVKWGSQKSFTVSALSGDFMKPVIHIGNILVFFENQNKSCFFFS